VFNLPTQKLDDRLTPKPVTLPVVRIRPVPDDAHDIKLQAQRLIQVRIVKAGTQAWQAITEVETFESWKRIGAALSIGKQHALAVSGANAPWGRNYCKALNEWTKRNGFGAMKASTRSVAIAMNEHIAEITAWRSTLPERQRQRLNGPQQNVRRWRRETANGSKRVEDAQKAASAAWRKFVRCVEALPADQAAPLWQIVREETKKRCLTESPTIREYQACQRAF
jgi:hypothetical protein